MNLTDPDLIQENKLKHILELLPEDIQNYLLQWGEKSYRVKQILNCIYQNGILDFDQMSSLSIQLRKKLASFFSNALPQILQTKTAEDGTRKYLLQLFDKSRIEMVMIPAGKKHTLCLSSQIGCSRGCGFCATAELGFFRNLTVAEIVAQIFMAKQLLKEDKLTNLVFMGMGEPLDNLDNLLKAVRLVQHEKCFNFSPRRITISTCGVIPGILKLAESGIKVKLAVSLNSAIQKKREALMPVSRIYPLAELKKALLDFRRKTAFRITFEYVMIKDFNMGKEDVKALLKFLGDISCKLNLIKWNEVSKMSYRSPSELETAEFIQALEKLSSAVTYRKSRGAEIAAACGQLAGKY